MNQLLLYGFLCALAPCLLASLHPLLGTLTRPLVYVLAVAQALIVPVLVALDPDITFGSDTYSLGAGIAIALIATVEFVFLIGTGAGVIAATSYISRRDRLVALERLDEILSDLPAAAAGSSLIEGTPSRD